MTSDRIATEDYVDAAVGGSGAPTDATYLVAAAHAGLSAEVPVGATPGGELGGTWGTPTVGATHSGSTHAAAQAAAEATAAGALATHEADASSVHGIANTADLYRAGGTDVAVADGGTGASTAAAARTNLGLGTAAVAATGDFEASGAVATHAAAGDPHSGYLTPAEGNAAYDAIGAAAAAAAASAPTSRTITAGTGLTGGGDLSANRTIGVDFGEAGDITTQAFGDAAAAGASGEIADAAHKHGMMALPAIDATGAATDITTRNVSTSAHGLAPKLPNDAAKYLDGTGAWSTPAGGGGGSTTKRVPIALDTPDASGNGYPGLTTNNGFTRPRRVIPYFTKDVLGTWEGAIRIPADYASAGKVVCSFVGNATSGVFRSIVSTSVVAAAAAEDVAYTDETAADTTFATTANRRVDVSVTLTTTPAAGSTLNVKITHDGAHANDTIAVDVGVWHVEFEYTT